MAKQSVTAASDEAVEIANSYKSVDGLLSHMNSIVDELAERDAMTYSVAAAGEVYARGEDGSSTIEASVFRQIQDNTMSTELVGHLRASLERLNQLLK